MKGSHKYYEATEKAYLALCPKESGHMNLGLWPTPSIQAAQENLISSFLEFYLAHGKKIPTRIIDGGSGWGGSRTLVARFFPGVPYLGINSSEVQVKVAAERNASIPGTEYLIGNIEEVKTFDLNGADVFFSIEAAFHFENKERLIQDLRSQGIEQIAIADICVEKREAVTEPYFSPALDNCWSKDHYLAAFAENGYRMASQRNVTPLVYRGWANHMLSLNPQEFGAEASHITRFQTSFPKLAQHADEGAVSYQFFHAIKNQR